MFSILNYWWLLSNFISVTMRRKTTDQKTTDQITKKYLTNVSQRSQHWKQYFQRGNSSLVLTVIHGISLKRRKAQKLPLNFRTYVQKLENAQ